MTNEQGGFAPPPDRLGGAPAATSSGRSRSTRVAGGLLAAVLTVAVLSGCAGTSDEPQAMALADAPAATTTTAPSASDAAAGTAPAPTAAPATAAPAPTAPPTTALPATTAPPPPPPPPPPPTTLPPPPPPVTQAFVPQAPSASYANCTDARNAGVTPLYRGDPGYGSHLDRDDDGIACE